jgi:Spy/CpxP family protein refolding chaperone
MLVQRKINNRVKDKKFMKITKMTLMAALAVGGLLALSPALRADDATNTPPAGGPPPGDRGPGMRGRGPSFDMVAQRLNLTDDQKPKVKAILDDQQEKMRGLWQDQDLSREDRMAKMNSIREETNTKLKAVLTAEQFQKFQEMRPRRGGPRNGPPGGPPPGDGGTNAPPAPPPQA